MNIGESVNEYGTRISLHRCDACGVQFSVCPANEGDDDGCLVLPCSTYDPARDLDRAFGVVERRELPQIKEAGED